MLKKKQQTKKMKSLNNFHNSQNKNLSSAWLSNKQSRFTSGSALKDISISDKKIMAKIIQIFIFIFCYIHRKTNTNVILFSVEAWEFQDAARPGCEKSS